MFDHSRIKFNVVVCHDQPLILEGEPGRCRPADFYDRTEPKQKALALLVPLSGRKPIIFLGERRSGKTSQIRQLREHLITNNAAEYIPVLVPWEGVTEEEQFSREILSAVSSYLKTSPGLTERVQALPLTENHSIRSTIESLRMLLALAPGRKLVLFIDEFDTILINAHSLVSMTEWIQVIGLAQSLVETGDLPVQLVLTAVHLSPLQIGARGSLLVSRAEIIRLEPFCNQDTAAMARDLAGQEHPLSDDDLAMLCDLSGGWPYFTKLLLYHLAELPISPEQIQVALSYALANISAAVTIANIYENHLSGGEKRLLLLLVARGGKLRELEIKSLDANLRAAAAELRQRGFVRFDAESSYQLRVAFLGHWFREWPRYELELARQDVNKWRMIVDQHANADDPFGGSTPFVAPSRESVSRIPSMVTPPASTDKKSGPAKRKGVFISYSHKDKNWLIELQTMLKPLLRTGAISFWDDTKIEPGAIWKDEIQEALASSKIAILLVSANFLASDFIAKNELPPLLEAAKGKGVVIFWIYVSSCLYESTEIANYQAAHDISRPLDRMSKPNRQAVLSGVCARIEGLIK
jgi:hypothetical protein